MLQNILVIENDIDIRMSIKSAYDHSGISDLSLEFRSISGAEDIPYGYQDYCLTVLDISPEPETALDTAKLIRSVKPDMHVMLLAPTAEFAVPVGFVEMGLGPVVICDRDGVADLPHTSNQIIETEKEQYQERVLQNDLKKRNRELLDITDTLERQSVHLLRLRNELSAEKSKLETVLHGMADGMVFFGVDGNLEMINPVAERLLPQNFPIEELDYETFRKNVIPSGKGKMEEGDEFETFDASFGSRMYRVRLAQVCGADGITAGSLALLTDITREREYEKLKDDFSSTISHELRTPLTSIRAAADNLLQGILGPVNEEQATFLDLIARNVDRQQNLVDDLLDLARLETGQMPLNMESVALPSLITNVSEQFKFAFKDKEIRFESIINVELPMINADSHLLIQLLNNLLSNALKFTEQGGAVTMTTGQERGDEGAYVTIAVNDTGVGIEKTKHYMIFEKHMQADSSMNRRYPWSGLGLSICREITHAHGGSIFVESAPGEGSRFVVKLPTAQDQQCNEKSQNINS